MANVGGKDTLDVGAPGGLGEGALRGVLLNALGLVVVVAKDTSLFFVISIKVLCDKRGG